MVSEQHPHEDAPDDAPMRQHSITWLGRTQVGKSLGSKTVLLAQSKCEITQADRQDLVPSIVTSEHLDFFKAEPITKFKPSVFDDGMLQRMDASFLKAFLNPSVPWPFMIMCLLLRPCCNIGVACLLFL